MKRVALFLLFAALLFGTEAAAHSGKARFHVIVDTDCAPDDLRALCYLLGNREVEVLAITTSEGALTPKESARRVAALLNEFHNQGIPVGAGRETEATSPAWRTDSRQVDWGDTTSSIKAYPPAVDLMVETLENEEEPVVCIALGALTNFDDLLTAYPAMRNRIERIIWYNHPNRPMSGANYRADKKAADRVLSGDIPVAIVSEKEASSMTITPSMIDSIATIRTPYAQKIVTTHRQPPLSELVKKGHLKGWDDLVVLYLFAPQLFTAQKIDKNVTEYQLYECVAAEEELLSILRGKVDTESRVFHGFPTQTALYSADVIPIIDTTLLRYGPSEWRAGVLTNELHGHLGIYATIGVKMGILAREYFNIGVDDIHVVSHAGHHPPISCMNDGLQVSTGATLGHGLIEIDDRFTPTPEALFSFKGKVICIALKPEYVRQIRIDIQKGVEQYGNTEENWQYVRQLALKYWRDLDRHKIFDLTVVSE